MTEQRAEESVGEVTPQLAQFEHPFRVDGGAVLPRWEIAYETYGELNAARDNAVLVCHALSGSQHAAGFYADAPKNIGWWDNFIGPGKPLDTTKFFVLSANNLGGCHGSTGPRHPHPEDGLPYGSRFPLVTVEDWVRAQKLLAERLGIGRFAAVVGGSLGGMQALRWAMDYPDAIGAAVIIAASARLTAFNIAFNDIARCAIMKDEKFYGGDFYQHNDSPRDGLSIARMLGHVTYLSDLHMAERFGRTRRVGADAADAADAPPQAAYGIEFEVESYLRYQGEKFSQHFDANTYLLMTKALDYFNPAGDGELTDALAAATAEFFLLSFSSDGRFPPAHSREMVRALLAAGKRASYMEMETRAGHDSFLLADPVYHGAVAAFMDGVAKRCGK